MNNSEKAIIKAKDSHSAKVYIHTCIHTNTQTRKQATVRIFKCTNKRANIQTYRQAYENTNIRTCGHARIQAYNASVQVPKRANVQTHKHPNIPTYDSTNLHRNTHEVVRAFRRHCRLGSALEVTRRAMQRPHAGITPRLLLSLSRFVLVGMK